MMRMNTDAVAHMWRLEDNFMGSLSFHLYVGFKCQSQASRHWQQIRLSSVLSPHPEEASVIRLGISSWEYILTSKGSEKIINFILLFIVATNILKHFYILD